MIYTQKRCPYDGEISWAKIEGLTSYQVMLLRLTMAFCGQTKNNMAFIWEGEIDHSDKPWRYYVQVYY
jgi:hypothetical protein